MGGEGLTVEFLGERIEVEPGRSLSFGRAADLVVDESNPYLHRVVGRFVWRDRRWWLENHGSQIELDLESDSGVRSIVPPRADDAAPVLAPLLGSRTLIRFTAARARYQLDVGHPDPEVTAPGEVLQHPEL